MAHFPASSPLIFHWIVLFMPAAAEGLKRPFIASKVSATDIVLILLLLLEYRADSLLAHGYSIAHESFWPIHMFLIPQGHPSMEGAGLFVPYVCSRRSFDHDGFLF